MVTVGHVPNVAALVDIWGCKALNLPLTYLGLPLGATLKKKKKDGVEFCCGRNGEHLVGLESMYLSKGGRVVLIKRALSNLPTYLQLVSISNSHKGSSSYREVTKGLFVGWTWR